MITLSEPSAPQAQPSPPPDWEVEVEFSPSDMYIILWAIDTLKQRIPPTHKEAFSSLKAKVRTAYGTLKML